jgi:citrate synthase
MTSDYATAVEALALLQVRPQTLYAYVSRGWIRSIAQKGQKEKLYLRDDLERVKKRSLARSGHGPVAASAMNWGEPIFATSVTEITARGPHYRGFLAADLVSQGVEFERVAELLWTGHLSNLKNPLQPWPVSNSEKKLKGLFQSLTSIETDNNLLEVIGMAILMLGVKNSQLRSHSEPSDTLLSAHEILQTIVGCCGLIGPRHKFLPMKKGQSLVEGLIQSFDLDDSLKTRDVLRAVLILLADHELPPGTLSARVVASSGGNIHNCIAAALCATAGVDVGRMYGRVDTFLGQPKSKSSLEKRARKLNAAGQRIPGFDHPLYPKGDPRAALLLDLASAYRKDNLELRSIFAFIDGINEKSTLLPRQELAVVVICRALGLPGQAAAALFAVSRTAGWVAHAIEQQNYGTLLRPRAQFVSGKVVQTNFHID